MKKKAITLLLALVLCLSLLPIAALAADKAVYEDGEVNLADIQEKDILKNGVIVKCSGECDNVVYFNCTLAKHVYADDNAITIENQPGIVSESGYWVVVEAGADSDGCAFISIKATGNPNAASGNSGGKKSSVPATPLFPAQPTHPACPSCPLTPAFRKIPCCAIKAAACFAKSLECCCKNCDDICDKLEDCMKERCKKAAECREAVCETVQKIEECKKDACKQTWECTVGFAEQVKECNDNFQKFVCDSIQNICEFNSCVISSIFCCGK